MSTMQDVQQTNTSMAEPKQLDIEDAILARWEDAEETQPSEDEDAVATSEEEPEALDPSDETEPEPDIETEDELDEDTDPDDEETADDPDEDDAEEDAEDEDEPQLVSDDADVEVTVDGVTERVSVASLKRLAGQERALGRKSQETAAQRKEAEAAMEKSHHLMQAMLAKAEERAKPYKEIDMLLASRQMEPQDFQQLRQEAKEAEDNLKFLTEEADSFYGEIQKRQQAAQQEAAKQCIKTLQEEMPEWSNQLYNDIRGYAVSIGLPQEQVDQYVDPVVIQLINKARLYDEGKKVATVKKTKAATSKKVLRSNKAPDPKAAKKAKAKRNREAMVASGGNDLDAITATILSRWEE